MKRALSLCVGLAALLGTLTTALAQTILYQEDWGTTNDGSSIAYAYNASSPAYPFGQLGWSIVVPAAQAGTGPPYEGIYVATGANDTTTGYSLPANTVYYTGMTASQTGFLYTTAGAGNGGSGDTAFPAGGINPAGGITLNAEVSTEGSAAVNYFAVQVGGQWYVSATPMVASAPTYPQFVNVCQSYTPTASAWNTLTVGANTVTIGSQASANLSGNITGIGIVQVGPGGWNYNEIAIQSSCGNLGVGSPAQIQVPPFSQTTYAGGGVSFVVQASGSAPLVYTWKQNGVVLTNGGRISGANTGTLTITNVNSTDAAATYEVDVSNDNGKSTATATGFTLSVNPLPSDYLYAETVPYIGPSGNLPLSSMGWVEAAPNGGIYSQGGGAGAVFAYTGASDTVIYFATTQSDTNQSGLAFPTINPANYQYLAFETSLDANSGVTDVTAYFAVEMTSGGVTNWYVHSTPIDEDLATTGVFETQELQFTTAKSAWNTLTIQTGGATIGSAASANLAGNITGAGLVFVFNGGGGDFNFDQFLITTDQVQATPPVIGDDGVPWPQTVYSGGGVSFQVTTQSGSEPFTYGWTLNGKALKDGTLPDGAVVSGATTPTVTISGVTTAESGGNGNTWNVIAYVTNSAGYDESDTYYGAQGTTLTVQNPAVGLIYNESFPWIYPATTGNYSIGPDGWTEAFYQSPVSLYNNNGAGDGAVFVYSGTPVSVAYYSDTTLDTNQSGLPFPEIALSGYPGSLSLQVDLEAGTGSGNVATYWAVQVGGNWYASASPLAAPGGSFATQTLNFNPAAANWDNLTVSPSGAVIGSTASHALTGTLTGAGLVFVVTGSGGDVNFDNFQINGSGLGAIIATPGAGNTTTTLSWVGNPAVNLQSATSLSPSNWTDVPNTLGKYSITVTNSGPQKFYRLIQHGLNNT